MTVIQRPFESQDLLVTLVTLVLKPSGSERAASSGLGPDFRRDERDGGGACHYVQMR